MATAYDTVEFTPPQDTYPAYQISKDDLILKLQRENNELAKQLASYKMLYRNASADAEAAAAALDRTVGLLANSRAKRRNLKEAYRKLQEAYNKLRRELDNYFAETVANG